ALGGLTSGEQNTAVGSHAAGAETTGANDTGVGFDALTGNQTGSGNTAIGASTLAGLASGDSNTAPRNPAGAALTTESNNIDIANAGVAADAGVIRIGTSPTITGAFIAGVSGATSSGGIAVLINSSGQLGTTTSSVRFKENVESMGEASDGLMQ